MYGHRAAPRTARETEAPTAAPATEAAHVERDHEPARHGRVRARGPWTPCCWVFDPPAAAIDLNSADFQIPAGTTIGTQEPLLSPEHIVPPAKGSYNTVPPTSGQHYNQAGLAPTTWGIKDSNLPNEVTTHNLEHGGIVIGYANLTPAETDQLKGIVRALMNGTYRKIILEPYPLTDAKVALTSWGWLLN